jgi:predicted ATPase
MYIQSLRLENIKSFESLELDFTRPNSSEYAGLNVFVGGNSSGKSTLLKGIAMAIAGPMVANQQVITPAGWVRRDSAKGYIELKIQHEPSQDQFKSRGKLPGNEGFYASLQFEHEFSANSTLLRGKEHRTPSGTRVQTAERGPWNHEVAGWFISAYGPMRRLTGSSTEALRYALGGGKLTSCVTLFREDAALSESETWLKQERARALEQSNQGTQPSKIVEDVQKFLNDGLLPQGFQIERISVDQVYMTTPNGGELPMRDLSDGCRSAFALILDIIHNMKIAYPDSILFETNNDEKIVFNKTGVILIDEIEAHLHPSWQRLICEWLKTRFPKIQFFITTHSPLIAQAADPGGLYVLPLPNEIDKGRTVRRLTPKEQERVSLGRAEKVLLGEAFGLKQTWGRQAEKLIARWDELSAKRHLNGGLKTGELDEYNALKQKMEIVFDDEVEGLTHA